MDPLALQNKVSYERGSAWEGCASEAFEYAKGYNSILMPPKQNANACVRR